MFSNLNKIEVTMAIKLGTNYSANAYMIRLVDPDDRKMLNVPFKTQTTSQMSVTTPTVALFDDNGTIKSYGSEAELQYIQLANRSKHLFFREFMWHLFCADDTIPENLSDVNGKRMNSVKVLSSVIKYMVSHVKYETGEDISGIPITFKYVFTIPTCSYDDSKRFMSEAADKAGCVPKDVIFVEEAAAALQFYMNSQYNGELQVADVSDRCYLVVEIEEAFQSLFTDAGNQIVQYLKKELSIDLSDIDSIILTGEFAQSPILQNIIMRSFPIENIQVPGEANMAAVKGAVLVGENNIHVETSECICGIKVAITENVCPSEENVQRSSTKESGSKPTRTEQSEKRNKGRMCVIQ